MAKRMTKGRQTDFGCQNWISVAVAAAVVAVIVAVAAVIVAAVAVIVAVAVGKLVGGQESLVEVPNCWTAMEWRCYLREDLPMLTIEAVAAVVGTGTTGFAAVGRAGTSIVASGRGPCYYRCHCCCCCCCY